MMENKITILGEEFFYKEKKSAYDKFTIFYQNYKARKFLFFKLSPKPIILFAYDGWITSPYNNRMLLKERLEFEVSYYNAAKMRQNEIENGIII